MYISYFYSGNTKQASKWRATTIKKRRARILTQKQRAFVSILDCLHRDEQVALATDQAVRHFGSGTRKPKGEKKRHALTKVLCN